jgi:hypothetical protein
VVHRVANNDYACITESTAEMRERYGIGEVVDTEAIIYDENSITPTVPTNPGTQCKERHVVVYHFEAKAYGCVLESVANTWIEEDKAEIHDLTKFILEKDELNDIKNKVFVINQEINEIYNNNILDEIQLKKKYDLMYQDADQLAKKDEKSLSVKYYSEGDMSKEELSLQIMEVRKNNEVSKEKILEDKAEALKDLKTELHKKMQQMKSEFDDNSAIKLVWNSNAEKFHAEKR